MSQVFEYFQQAELSLAAYANLITGEPSQTELIRAGMSATQAAAFASKWIVVGTHYNDPVTGVSATVFADAAGNKYLAIRGTQGTTDYLADYLILRGIPSQLNPQYLSLKAKVLEWINDPNVLKDTTFTVSGHSLGGYLAAGLVADFSASISHAYLYNAPGNNSLVSQIMQALGIAATPDAAKITSLRADAGISPIAGLGNDFSPPISIAIENQLLAANPPAALNHSQQILTDALAVYNLFAQLDPSLNSNPTSGIQTITNILKASSNIAANTLESAVSALGKLFLVNGAAGFNGNEFDSGVTGRDLLYTALNDIGAAIAASGGGLTVRDLTAFGAAQIASVAQNNLAYRYALVNGNPFALVGNDAVYARHNNNGELDLFDPATRTGALTDQYLKDRSAFLVDKTIANTQDNLSNGMGYVEYAGAKQYFRDESGATPTTIVLGGGLLANQLIGQPPDDIQQIRFGSNTATDILTGGTKDDHLYGMGGDDTLQGNGGNDYLEGGKGFDTYKYNTGDGSDTILDSDGQGRLYLGAGLLDGGESKDGGRTWQSSDGQHTYTLISGDINAAAGATIKIDNSLTLQHYRAGELGLTLNGAAAPQPAPIINTITGDIAPADTDPGTAGIQAARDTQGNLIGTAQPYEDILAGTAGDDHILSGELNDNAAGKTGNDWLEGGNGADYLNGDEGNDLVEGGQGADILAGDAGDDLLYGGSQIAAEQAIASGNVDTATGAKGDWLSGGSGNDTLITGADNDVLAGGGGNDLLIAGAGDDHILGDADYTPQFITEAAPRYTVPAEGISWYHTASAPFDWTTTQQPGGATVFAPVTGTLDPADSGNDIIHAGDGADKVWAGSGGDVVYGEAGADRLDGEGGNDILFGGAGDDTLYGDGTTASTGDDYLDGGNGNDTLWGGNGADILAGGNGDDKLYGEAGANYLEGGDGNDTLNSDGSSALYGGAGDDDLTAVGGGNTLDGGADNDTLATGGDGNTLDGGEGNNSLQATGGGNALFAGAGNDDLAAWGDGNYLDAGNGNNTLYAQGANNELHAGAGGDNIQATGGGNTLDAGDGNNTLIADTGGNTLTAGTGNDSLSAAGGNSRLDGGAGADTLTAAGGNNTLTGGAGDDTLRAYGGGNTLDGGEGRDLYVFDAGFGTNHIADSGTGQARGNTLQFNFAFAGSGIVVGLGSLKLSFATGDELHIDNFDPNDPTGTCSIDTFVFSDRTLSLQAILDLGGPAVDYTRGPDITGTANADTLQGTDKSEHIYALAGDDSIAAGARNDTIEAGAGNDILDGGTGADSMKGGAGNDTYTVDNTGDTLTENPNEGRDTVQSSVSHTLGANLESLILTGADNIDGAGNALDNYLAGNGGNNMLSGGDGADQLDGDGGDDTINAGTILFVREANRFKAANDSHYQPFLGRRAV